MRIFFIGINYWPEETGIAAFTTGRCEYLASRGHEVTVCTTFPYYPDWRTMAGYRGRLKTHERRNQVNIDRTWIYVPTAVTAARRVVHEASFVATSFLRAIPKSRPDVVIVVSPPLGLAVSAIVLKRRWLAPYVFHVEDLQPDAAVDLGMLPPGRIVKMLYALERAAYRQAAMVSTLTPEMRRKIIHKGVPAEKVAISSLWVEPALFSLPLAGGGETFRQTYGVQNRFLVTHSGNMGVKQGLEVILGAAERARQAYPQFLFLLVGDGAMKSKLEEVAQRRRLDNVRFLPLLATEVFHELLAASDLCLVTQQKNVADIVFPSKVLTLLAAGRPLVASLSNGSEVARVMNEARAGPIVPPEDSQALFDAIVRLHASRGERVAMGASGRAYARKHWDKELILLEFEARLSQIASGNASEAAFRPATGGIQ